MQQSASSKITPAGGAPKLKRKLPPPVFRTPNSSEPTSQSDPALHQGRKRSKPHVDGDWPTHIYISIKLPSDVRNVLQQTVQKSVQEASPRPWHSLLQPDSPEPSLHLSLSRPIFLKTNERHEFLNQLQRAIRPITPFEIYFSAFSTFMNDDCTRGFLALEVGSGHSALTSLLQPIDSVLAAFFQPIYYTSPRFHVSIGWCLIEQEGHSRPIPAPEILPLSLIQRLNDSELDLVRSSSWHIAALDVLIGKTTHHLKLNTAL